jgi:hypothetical protein
MRALLGRAAHTSFTSASISSGVVLNRTFYFPQAQTFFAGVQGKSPGHGTVVRVKGCCWEGPDLKRRNPATHMPWRWRAATCRINYRDSGFRSSHYNRSGRRPKRTRRKIAAAFRISPLSLLKRWSRDPDLNRRPVDYESTALPTELPRP